MSTRRRSRPPGSPISRAICGTGPDAKAACLKAAAIAHRHGRQVALSLSDPFCVDRWRAEFAELIARHVDILIANEVEICSLYGADELEQARRAGARPGPARGADPERRGLGAGRAATQTERIAGGAGRAGDRHAPAPATSMPRACSTA